MSQVWSEISNLEIPVHLISLRENMFENIASMLKFLFKYCEEQEHNIQEVSLVNINLLKGDNNQGDIQIDVDGSWLKKFVIRKFIVECNKHEKLSFEVYYGNVEKSAYYFYQVKYDDDMERAKTKLDLEENPIINKDCYLRLTINSTENILQSILVKLRNFIHVTGPKYPNVTIQFDESTYKWNKNSDEMCIKMISESFADVLQYSTNSEFRRKIFECLNVTSKEWAMKEVYNKLKKIIGEDIN